MAKSRGGAHSSVQAAALMMLAPAVIWMRLPLMFVEMAGWKPGRRNAENERAVFEKMGAGMEAAGKINAELAGMWAKAWIDIVSGSPGSVRFLAGQSEQLAATALEPYARRVGRNARRLSKR